MEYKYVMLQIKSKSSLPRRLIPIIFPCELVHSEVIEAAKSGVISIPGDGGMVCVSAGFVDIDASLVYGYSESAELEVHREDTAVINSMPYRHGLGFDKREIAHARKK